MFTQSAIREPAAAHTERRRYERHALRCQCWLEGDDLTIYGATADVGIGGLFLRTGVPVEAGVMFDVVLQASDAGLFAGSDHEARMRGVVARGMITHYVPARTIMRDNTLAPGLRHGLGVEFLEIHAGELELSTWLSTSTRLPWLTQER